MGEAVAGFGAGGFELGEELRDGVGLAVGAGELFEGFGVAGDVVEAVGAAGAGEFVGGGGDLGHGAAADGIVQVGDGLDGAVAEFPGEAAEDGIFHHAVGDGGDAGLAGEALDQGEEGGHVDGLGGIFVAAGAHAAVAVFLEGMGGEGDDDALITIGTELGGGGVAIHHGHLHIHEDDLKGVARTGRLDGDAIGFFAIVGAGDIAPGVAKMESDDIAALLAILGEEDADAQLPLAVFHRAADAGEGVAGLAGREHDGAGGGHGQDEAEGAAAAQLALEGDVAIHFAGEAAGNGQAEAGSAEAAGGGYIGLGEGLKEPLLLGGGDADAGVDHVDGKLPRGGLRSCGRGTVFRG